MFADTARVSVRAGTGGSGCASFRREKYVPRGGPDGGDGGKGGDVIVRVDAALRTLLECRRRPHVKAERGRHGEGGNRTGRSGADAVVRVPPGTTVYDTGSGQRLADLVEPGDELIAARGGRGGRGNARFATSVNQAPRTWEPGEEGEERTLGLELKLIADVGLVGQPNAGKSTLLSSLSAARPKIADYAFTTLEPSLGLVALDEHLSCVMADIPGLIEGASTGKGLGLEFLRHIERTQVLLFLVDLQQDDPMAALALLRRELDDYSAELKQRPAALVLTKLDLVAPLDRQAHLELRGLPVGVLPDRTPGAWEKVAGVPCLAISAASSEGLDRLRTLIVGLLEAAAA